MNQPCVRCSLPSYSRGLCAGCYTREFNAEAWRREENRRIRGELRQELTPEDEAEKERRIQRYAEQHESGKVLNYRAVVDEQKGIESPQEPG